MEGPYEAIRQAYLVGTDTDTPHVGHVKESEGFGTSSTGSTSSNSTTLLSPDHPLTRDTPVLVPSLRRNARMAVRVQQCLSPDYSLVIVEAASLLFPDVAFHKRVSGFWKVGRRTAEDEVLLRGMLNLPCFDDERGEDEAVPEGARVKASPVVETTVGKPLRLGYGALRCRELATEEDQRSLEQEKERAVMTFRALWRPVLALETWTGTCSTLGRNIWHGGGIHDDQRLVHDLLVQQNSLQHELQEMRGRVTVLEQERDREEQ
ncbi:hypothetical protein Tco_0924601 [Tanacetum coccineum]|uniref:Uncharacterized protein n=1 Tax=Tanacetum coccineum TaxID=301880 RepID=A0ABQ5D5D2_9ASTR